MHRAHKAILSFMQLGLIFSNVPKDMPISATQLSAASRPKEKVPYGGIPQSLEARYSQNESEPYNIQQTGPHGPNAESDTILASNFLKSL